MSQEKIADMLGVSRSTVARWHKGGIIDVGYRLVLTALKEGKITLEDIGRWRGRQVPPAASSSTTRVFGKDGFDQDGFDAEDFDRDGIKRGYRERLFANKGE